MAKQRYIKKNTKRNMQKKTEKKSTNIIGNIKKRRGVEMNREQVRKLKKQGYSQKVIMDRYRQEAIDQGFSEGIKHTYKVVLLLTAYALNNHLGLGKKRLPEVMNKIMLYIDSFNTQNLFRGDLPVIASEMKKIGFDIEDFN